MKDTKTDIAEQPLEESLEVKQQRNEWAMTLAGFRMECCKLCKGSNGEVNLTRAEKLLNFVMTGKK